VQQRQPVVAILDLQLLGPVALVAAHDRRLATAGGDLGHVPIQQMPPQPLGHRHRRRDGLAACPLPA
jgi:hypothetical protein